LWSWVLFTMAWAYGCGGSSTVTVTISPTTATVKLGQTEQFTAAVTGNSNTSVTWAVNNVTGGNASIGTITTAGFYTAPSNAVNASSVSVTATSVVDTSKSATATVTINSGAVVTVLPTTGATVAVGDCYQFSDTVTNLTSTTEPTAVNWYVNKRVRFVDDQRRWGRADVWSAANETLNSGKGDCEDYAIAKLAMLRRAGVADKDLYLVILKDTVRRADHAVLVVRARHDDGRDHERNREGGVGAVFRGVGGHENLHSIDARPVGAPAARMKNAARVLKCRNASVSIASCFAGPKRLKRECPRFAHRSHIG